MEDLTTFQHNALVAIAGLSESEGLAVKNELKNYYARDVHHGAIAPES